MQRELSTPGATEVVLDRLNVGVVIGTMLDKD